MLKRILAYIFGRRRTVRQKYVSLKDLEEYMRIEGVSYGDMFPPNRKET